MRQLTRLDRRAPGETQADTTVTLGFVDRHRRRILLSLDDGTEALLNLSQPEHLHDGDHLVGQGLVVAVRAAIEPVLQVRGDNLARIAWHIGNRHLPAQIDADSITIGADHVIAEMLRGLGADVIEAQAAFNPEPGAYHSHHE